MSNEPAPQQNAIEINGVLWYSQKALCELLGKTSQTLRNWTKTEPPIVIKDESMGVKLYRLADGVKVISGSPEPLAE